MTTQKNGPEQDHRNFETFAEIFAHSKTCDQCVFGMSGFIYGDVLLYAVSKAVLDAAKDRLKEAGYAPGTEVVCDGDSRVFRIVDVDRDGVVLEDTERGDRLIKPKAEIADRASSERDLRERLLPFLTAAEPYLAQLEEAWKRTTSFGRRPAVMIIDLPL